MRNSTSCNSGAKKTSQIRERGNAACHHVGEFVYLLLRISGGTEGVLDLPRRETGQKVPYPFRISPWNIFADPLHVNAAQVRLRIHQVDIGRPGRCLKADGIWGDPPD